MSTKRFLDRKTSPTGLTVWQLPRSDMQIVWIGPGAGLSVGCAYRPGATMTRVEHPTADGQYDSLKDAEAAVRRFLDASGLVPIPFDWGAGIDGRPIA